MFRLPRVDILVSRAKWLGQRDSKRLPLGTFLASISVLMSALAVVGATTSDPSPAPAREPYLPIDYAQFYGLDPWDRAVANADYDFDGLKNEEEARLGTDPYDSDTDGDLLFDGDDLYPISRFKFGSPRFIDGDYYNGPAPEWCPLGAFQQGGEWIILSQTQAAWYCSSETATNVGSLSVFVDREILDTNVIYSITYWNSRGSGLYFDLLSSNEMVVASNLFGNLMTGSNQLASIRLAVPLSSYPSAAILQLRRGYGEVAVFEGQIYKDFDNDGLDEEAEIFQYHTSDHKIDSNNDGILDWNHVFVYHTDPAKTNEIVAPVPTPNPTPAPDKKKHIIYVDKRLGDDSLSGQEPTVTTGKHGPKKTISKALEAVDKEKADTLIIKEGIYNENLDVRHKNLTVRFEGKVRLGKDPRAPVK